MRELWTRIDRRRRAGRVIRRKRGRTPGSRILTYRRGGQPGGVTGILCIEFLCDTDYSGRRAVQPIRHRPHIGEHLIGMRCELLGELTAHIVVAPATLGLFQAIL
ncbi:hypothetical protein [Nocardia sp. SC052]|uniref:hypothetical protein n=1 Tax=Nocardia sichangensis TaxID=3385975 RepID=UPI0039A004EB